jgi:hypothetical protein
MHAYHFPLCALAFQQSGQQRTVSLVLGDLAQM